MKNPISEKIKRRIFLILSLLLVCFIIGDLAKSFIQYNIYGLDGDIGEAVHPKVEKLFEDPFGFKAIAHDEPHFGANRFFAHYIFAKTILNLPIFLQNFTDPISSVYLSCAITRIIMHICLLLISAILITGSLKIISLESIFSAALISTFFQSAGYVRSIGLIDPSITYSFFYALPLVFLMLYFLPVLFRFFHDKELKLPKFLWPVWGILLMVSCLGGPTNPGIALVMTAVIFLFEFAKQFRYISDMTFGKRVISAIKNIPKIYYIYLIPIIILSFYSLFLGTYNPMHTYYEKDLMELYRLMWKGLPIVFTSELPWPILFALLVVNYTLIFKLFRKDERTNLAFKILAFLLCFAVIYILLLPLGGYREWRPNVVRYDSIMAITFFTFVTVGYSSLFLLKKLKYKAIPYSVLLLFVMIIFTKADKLYDTSVCEKESLAYIRDYPDDVVPLENNCAVVHWVPAYTPESSYYNSKLLHIWRITDRLKLYYNVPETDPQEVL